MKTILLDCRLMTGREEAHTYLARKLELPAYYGKNLDALSDCLEELLPCRVLLERTDALQKLGPYGGALLSVFRDMAEEQPRFELRERP